MNDIINNEKVMAEVKDVMVDEVINKGFVLNKYAKGSLVLAGIAACAVIGKIVYDKFKPNNELRQPDKEIVVEAEDLAEVVTD